MNAIYADITWHRDNDRAASSERCDDQEQGHGACQAQKCSTQSPRCEDHEPTADGDKDMAAVLLFVVWRVPRGSIFISIAHPDLL